MDKLVYRLGKREIDDFVPVHGNFRPGKLGVHIIAFCRNQGKAELDALGRLPHGQCNGMQHKVCKLVMRLTAGLLHRHLPGTGAEKAAAES